MTERPEYTCYRAARPIAVDGVLDDPSWQGAQAAHLVLATTGEAPRQATEARLLWDDDYLYVAFVCQDNDIWATMTARDDHLWEEEVVEIFVDADRDNYAYEEIEVNPLNTVLDLLVLNRGGKLRQLWGWDSEGLLTAVTVDGDPTRRGTADRSWTVEMAIPMADFMTAPNLPPKPGDVWHVNLYRIERGADGVENTCWSPVGRPSYHTPERFGRLVFSDKAV